MIVTAAEYRKSVTKTFVTKVPSGAFFQVKILTPIDFIRNGLIEIPSEFFKFIGQILVNGSRPLDTEENKKNIVIFEKFLQIIVECGILSPTVTIKLDKEKIDSCLLFNELSIADQEYLIKVITGRIDPVIE